jgi:hypothetical protein
MSASGPRRTIRERRTPLACRPPRARWGRGRHRRSDR